MSTLHLSLLGAPQLKRDQQLVPLKAAKAVALLAYLAVTGEPQRREHLVDLLWPNSRPDAGRQNLSNRLWSIRTAFGDVIITVDSQHLAFSDTVWTDVSLLEAIQPGSTVALPSDDQRFAQLQSAIEVWRGPFLDGLQVVDAPDFELWLTSEQERLEQLYLKTATALVCGYQASSNWSAVIATAQAALQVDRLQEPMAKALMDAYARSGQRAEALRAYDSLHSALNRELGVEPLPETRELRDAILNGQIKARSDNLDNEQGQDQFSDSSSSQPSSSEPSLSILPTARKQPELAHPPSIPFVGRKAELAFLTDAFDEAARGKAQIVLISGELGIGKSSLWQAWSKTVSNQGNLFNTHCLDTLQTLPLTPLVTLLNRPATLDGLLRAESGISPIWLTELSRLLPEIQQTSPDLPAPLPIPPEEERRRLFEASVQALLSLRADCTQGPLTLFIDDLHWADPSTLDWLVYLLDRMKDEPFLLIGTLRPPEIIPRLGQMIAQWQRSGIAQELALTGLATDETNQLIQALGGDLERSAEIQTKSAGNPYFLIELIRAEPSTTPRGLAELVNARLQQLPTMAQQLLQAAAIYGNRVDAKLLQRMTHYGADETLNALDTLLTAGVFVEDGDAFAFSHPLIAVIIREGQSRPRYTYLHRQVAQALEAIYANQLPLIAGQLVTHYKEADEPALTARYADLAADHAQSLGAVIEAVAFRRVADASEPNATRKINLGKCLLFDDHHLDEARLLFQEGLAGFEEAGDNIGIARACLALGASYMLDLQGHKVLHWTERALTYLSHPIDPVIGADISRQLGAGNMFLGRPAAEVEVHYVKAIHLAREYDQFEIVIDSLFGLGNFYIQREEYNKAKTTFEEAIELAQSNNIFFLEAITYNNLAYCLFLMNQLAEAHVAVEKGLQLAEAYALFGLYQYLYSTRGEIALAENALDEAETWLQKSMIEAETYHNRTHIESVRANLGLVAQRKGDLEQALTYLQEAWVGIADETDLFAQTKVGLQLAELHLQRNEKQAAKKVMADVEQSVENQSWPGLKSWLCRLQAELTRL